MQVYHVVTEKTMYRGQKIFFDKNQHNGVYHRVCEKRYIVNDIYAEPMKYNVETLEHHTSVALRELVMEEVRQTKFPQYPSRMGCLYVSRTLEEAEKWGAFFHRLVVQLIPL